MTTHSIHPTALVNPKAQLGSGVEIGPYAIIGDRVSIGAGTKVGAHVVIEGWVTIGAENQIFPGVVIGLEPQDVSYHGALSRVEIGDRNQIREYVTIHRATQADTVTKIGDRNFLMTYVHVGHNCQIENDVIIANSVSLGGYVHIESKAVLGGVMGIHQYVRIGQCAMVGGMSRINRDVPPYLLAEGNPARVRGLNRVGLKRSGMGPESAAFQDLKQAYRLLFHSDLPFAQALEQFTQQDAETPLAHLIQFIQQAQSPPRRGIISGRASSGRASSGRASSTAQDE